MKAARILVTGANGFVGQALCRRLIDLGCDVYGLDRADPLFPGFREFYRKDITKVFTLKNNFDFVFHLAAYNVTHVGHPDADLYRLVNVLGTESVLKSVQADHFIFLSTTKVYLNQGKLINEDSPLLPLQEYEKSKLAAEQLCYENIDSQNLLIFRSVNIVGAGQPPKAVIPVFFSKASLGEVLEIFAPRGLVLQFLFVEDIVDAFVKVIEKENVSGIYNLASSDHIRLDQLAQMIKDICCSRSAIHCVDQSAPMFSPVSSVKAENTFDWKAKTTIKEILESYKK